jgi:hypothetical protein
LGKELGHCEVCSPRVSSFMGQWHVMWNTQEIFAVVEGIFTLFIPFWKIKTYLLQYALAQFMLVTILKATRCHYLIWQSKFLQPLKFLLLKNTFCMNKKSSLWPQWQPTHIRLAQCLPWKCILLAISFCGLVNKQINKPNRY